MRSVLLLFPVLSAVYGYKILCVFPVPSPSHNTLARGVVNSLLKGGHQNNVSILFVNSHPSFAPPHSVPPNVISIAGYDIPEDIPPLPQVTWVTPFPFKSESNNLTILPSDTEMIGKEFNMADPKYANAGISFVKQFANNISVSTIRNERLRHTLTYEQFDAVLTEWFFSKHYAGIAAVQRVPWIMLSGVIYNAMMEEIVDEVRSVSTIPLMMNDAPLPMNLKQRLVNTAMYLLMSFGEWLDSFSTSSEFESLFAPLAAARGVSLPPLSEVENNVSILFVNSHPSFAPSHSVPPNVIPVAGYHIPKDVPPLPQDLKSVLDNSTQGVVYFSMGSVVKSSDLPDHLLKALIKILGELPYTVLWKFEKELSGLPKNVHIRAWMPQPSILAHPNVKLFITHGGLLSTLEALHFGVPLLAVPVFGDQPGNAARAARSGYAKTVPFSPNMAPELKKVLKEMLSDDTYYKRAKYLSRLFRNREVAPSKLIAHYVEVAIESKGAYHLRSPSKLYAWYQRWMLDQIAVLVAILYVLAKVLKKLVSLCVSQKESKKKRN